MLPVGLRSLRSQIKPFATIFSGTNSNFLRGNPHFQTHRLPQRSIVSRAAKEVTKKPDIAEKAASRMPKSMSKYGKALIGAPVSHVTAFLLVHELSAIVPLFGLWYAFNYFDYMPSHIPDWIFTAGEDFIKKLAERNNWSWLESAEGGSKMLLHGVAAYAVVKATLPLRILFSLWVMPWTARRVIQPVTGLIGRVTGLKRQGPKQGELPEKFPKKKRAPVEPRQDP